MIQGTPRLFTIAPSETLERRHQGWERSGWQTGILVPKKWEPERFSLEASPGREKPVQVPIMACLAPLGGCREVARPGSTS